MRTIEELLETGRLVRARELEESQRREQEKEVERQNQAAAYRAAVEVCVQDALPLELLPFVQYPERMRESYKLERCPTVEIVLPALVPIRLYVLYNREKGKASVWQPRCVGVSDVVGNILDGYHYFSLDELPYALALAEERYQRWQENIRELDQREREGAAAVIEEEVVYQAAEENGSGVTLEHARGQALRDIVEEIVNEILDERGL